MTEDKTDKTMRLIAGLARLTDDSLLTKRLWQAAEKADLLGALPSQVGRGGVGVVASVVSEEAAIASGCAYGVQMVRAIAVMVRSLARQMRTHDSCVLALVAGVLDKLDKLDKLDDDDDDDDLDGDLEDQLDRLLAKGDAADKEADGGDI